MKKSPNLGLPNKKRGGNDRGRDGYGDDGDSKEPIQSSLAVRTYDVAKLGEKNIDLYLTTTLRTAVGTPIQEHPV